MIVIPMAGLSSRFFKAGYTLPKYMLKARGKSLFSHSVNSFHLLFQHEYFLFVIRDIHGTADFVRNECRRLGVTNYGIITLTEPTRGQAETVYLALKNSPEKHNGPVTIFNIDSIRYDFEPPEFTNTVDGYLEVFKGSGDNWSFAEEDPQNPGLVIRTAEKQPISDLCSDGLYYFRSAEVFCHYFELMEQQGEMGTWNGEYYIAPMYNYMIRDQLTVRYHLIDASQIDFSGTPDEYKSFSDKGQ